MSIQRKPMPPQPARQEALLRADIMQLFADHGGNDDQRNAAHIFHCANGLLAAEEGADQKSEAAAGGARALA